MEINNFEYKTFENVKAKYLKSLMIDVATENHTHLRFRILPEYI